MEKVERKVMKNVVLKGDFDEKFIDMVTSHSNEFYYDSYNNLRQPYITIFISSGGGSGAASEILISLINSEPERFRVIAVDHIQSAAFRFFFEVECDKCILRDCIGMYHISRQEMEMGFNSQPYFQVDKFLLKNYPEYMKRDLEWCDQLGMTAEHIEQIAKGNNVYFTPEQMQGFINKQKDDRISRLEKERIDRQTKIGGGKIQDPVGVVREPGITAGVEGERMDEHHGCGEVRTQSQDGIGQP